MSGSSLPSKGHISINMHLIRSVLEIKQPPLSSFVSNDSCTHQVNLSLSQCHDKIVSSWQKSEFPNLFPNPEFDSLNRCSVHSTSREMCPTKYWFGMWTCGKSLLQVHLGTVFQFTAFNSSSKSEWYSDNVYVMCQHETIFWSSFMVCLFCARLVALNLYQSPMQNVHTYMDVELKQSGVVYSRTLHGQPLTNFL